MTIYENYIDKQLRLLTQTDEDGRTPYIVTNPELWEDFTIKDTVAITVADSGQTWDKLDNGAANSALTIINGKLTNTANIAGPASGYIQVELENNANRIGGQFTLGPYSTPDGAAVFIIWKTRLLPGLVPPDTGCHLLIKPEMWEYAAFDGGVYTIISNGDFDVPLSADDTTVYNCEVNISGDTATVLLPDGTVKVITDSLIEEHNGPFTTFEVYAGVASTDSKAKFLNVYAGDEIVTDRDTHPTFGEVLNLFDNVHTTYRPKVITYKPLVDANIVVPNTPSNADSSNLVVEYTIPPGVTSVIVTLQAFLDMIAPDSVLWGVMNNGVETGYQRLTDVQINQTFSIDFLIEGLIPGTVHGFVWRHFCLAGSTSQIRLNSPFGFSATMIVTPI